MQRATGGLEDHCWPRYISSCVRTTLANMLGATVQSKLHGSTLIVSMHIGLCLARHKCLCMVSYWCRFQVALSVLGVYSVLLIMMHLCLKCTGVCTVCMQTSQPKIARCWLLWFSWLYSLHFNTMMLRCLGLMILHPTCSTSDSRCSVSETL